jgi:hypothetical protein
MASRARRKKIRTAAISDPIRVAFVIAYISPAVTLAPPECDIERLRTFFYKVCEMITIDANFVDAYEILNDMKLALLSHVDYYRQEEYTDFQRILTEIETKIVPAIQAQTDTFDLSDLQADIGYIQMIMKEIYIPPSQEGDQSTSEYTPGSVHPSDHTYDHTHDHTYGSRSDTMSVHTHGCVPQSDHTHDSGSVYLNDRISEYNSDRMSEHISEQFTDHTSEHSSERNSMPYTHKSSHKVSRMILKVLRSIIRSIPYPDIIRYTNTFISYIETAYHSNEGLERLQDKLISMIGNINHGVSPGIIKMRVDFIKSMLDNCVPS